MHEETAPFRRQSNEDGDENGDDRRPREAYANRMRATLLPQWPQELLIEWLWRHNGCLSRYVFLDFTTLSFARETWTLDRIPGSEAIDNRGTFGFAHTVEERARSGWDWPAAYMYEHGTWNTPIVLLDNTRGKIMFVDGSPLQSPYHLLEGHQRLYLLNGLRAIGKANATHEVWIATKTAS